MEQKAHNLKEILSQNKYIIPIYQRNYAWGKAEISQLITDITEFFTDDKTNKSYYLGSLVYFKRENGDLELIDGQQRHTTITLINLALKNWKFKDNNQRKIENVIGLANLKFDSRKNTQQFIEELYKDFSKTETTSITGIENIKSAIGIIQEELRDKNIEIFAKNFYDNVKLFLVEVPQDTDLNHYFEIMNNRGEQLEKHEIVKSLLMGKIKNDDENIEKNEQGKFALIWDACSDMSDYVGFNFDSDTRKNVFEQSRDIAAKSFDEILISKNEENENTQSLNEILEKHTIPQNFPKEENPAKAKYKSVIDFPNFLLQILKQKNENVSLDDKKLLEQFHSNDIDPKQFIYDLLKYRIIFDKYIIKQDLSDSDEDKQNWSIRTINTELDGVEKTYKENDEELIKLQTMLYYSSPSNTNNWVQEILNFEQHSDSNKYTSFIFEIAKTKFENEKLTYPDITIFNLYFIDFLLWKLYKEDIQSKNQNYEKVTLEFKIAKNKKSFDSFKFKQLNSKEHLLPQSKATEIEKDYLNDLGNLCLISTAQNSSANDQHPKYKKEQFKIDNSSLKRLIMFESFENENWGINPIKNHGKEIESLIKQFGI